jgi:hypothetical protein
MPLHARLQPRTEMLLFICDSFSAEGRMPALADSPEGKPFLERDPIASFGVKHVRV